MLRRIRIILAGIFLLGITLLFFGIGADWWGWMAKLQFLPATERFIGSLDTAEMGAIGSATFLNLAVISGIILLTLVFGRIYCSVICPLGVFQDIIIWLRRKFGLRVNGLKAKKFTFSPERKLIRYGMLVLTIVAMVVGIQAFISLIAPYSAYGRMIRGIAGITDGSPLPLVITALATLLVITACALLGGRIWCNTVCPVGTVLGLFSRFAILKPHIDTSKCINCGRCVRDCKSSCIDGENHVIDYSRCVGCFDCLGNCSVGAISYSKAGPGNQVKQSNRINRSYQDNQTNQTNQTNQINQANQGKQPDVPPTSGATLSRREFLSIGALLAGGAIADAAENQGGLAPITEKKSPERSGRIVPPGAQSTKNFYDRCTACQLCVASCPNGVLRPSTDLQHLLQPEAGYEKGYCRPECVECSKVCPAGAILPIDRDEKTLIHIGTAKVNPDLCIACGNCARHCPTGAIRMVEVEGHGKPMPVVMEEVCIGCGACEYLCPTRPLSAITVDGLDKHHIG